jgi:class 3 adenylate cyclase
VTVHAYALAQLIDGTRVADPGPLAVLALLIGVACLGGLIGWADLPTGVKVALLLLLVAGLFAAGFALYASRVAMIPLLTPGLAGVAAFALAAAYAGRHHRAAERYIRRAFAQYVSPQVMERISSRPESLELGGEKREMSFVFSDVAGFTTLSERLSPDRLVSLLERYLDEMVEIALRHDGTIDKFIGDAIVVFFGAPAEQADHAARAVACALEMDRFAEAFRSTHGDTDAPFGITRIGVHTGVATVGNFGGRRRFDYTALGDAVNTAARLESVNRHLGTRVCVSGATVAEGRVEGLRPVGRLVLKGKESGIDVFSTGDEASGRFAATGEYLEAYRRIEDDPEGAREAFESLSRRHPEDGLVEFHRDRLARGERGARIVMEAK